MRAGPRANPYARRARKISPQILCGADQPGLLFAGQIWGGPAHIATLNNLWVLKLKVTRVWICKRSKIVSEILIMLLVGF